MKKLTALITVFMVIWCVLGFNLSRLESPTFDEPVHAKAGALYNQGIYDFDPIEPPLVRQTVVTISQALHVTDREVIVCVNGLLISILLLFLAKESYASGVLAVVLFVLEPNVLAFGHYFITDMVSAGLVGIGLYILLTDKWRTRRGWWLMVILLGLAASAKVATLSLIIPLLLYKARSVGIKRLVMLSGTIFLLIWATYGFHLDHPTRQFSIAIPFGGYLRALKENIQFASRGQPIYFWSHIYTKGPWFKQIIVLLLKTSLPVLLLAFVALKTNTKSRIFVPVLIVGMLVHTFTSLHFGIRHMLPLLFFLIIIASQVKMKATMISLIVGCIAIWQLLGLRTVWPQPITFVNEIARANAVKVFTDSDFDWGQGLVELKQQLTQRNMKDYQLAYFGNVDPKDYLGEYHRIKDDNPVATTPISSLDVHKPILISETCYYMCGYYLNPDLKLEKAEVLAHSFLYFHD